MTPEQKSLARRALGLNGKQRISFRNRYYFVTASAPGFEAWADMVKKGLAMARRVGGAGMVFSMTTHGAFLALNPFEYLDPDDFPVMEEAV